MSRIKFGGPLYRFGRSLESIGSGDLSLSVKLREHDQLAEIAASLNGMIEGLRGKVVQIQEEIDQLKTKAEGQGWTREEIRRDLDTLHQKTHYLFKTGK